MSKKEREIWINNMDKRKWYYRSLIITNFIKVSCLIAQALCLTNRRRLPPVLPRYFPADPFPLCYRFLACLPLIWSFFPQT